MLALGGSAQISVGGVALLAALAGLAVFAIHEAREHDEDPCKVCHRLPPTPIVGS